MRDWYDPVYCNMRGIRGIRGIRTYSTCIAVEGLKLCFALGTDDRFIIVHHNSSHKRTINSSRILSFIPTDLNLLDKAGMIESNSISH